MERRKIDEEVQLVPYYPNYTTTLAWYQDLDVLKAMYKYLNRKGDLFYIKFRNRLCGDVCLQPDGEVNIVVAKPFQNRHIGRRVIKEIILLAKEKGISELHAVIYSFNTQSRNMFEAVGFRQTDDETYVLVIE